MKFYHSLYLSEELLEKKDEIIRKLKNGEWQFHKYLIVMPEKENNQLEFYDSVLLLQKAICSQELFVIGIADGSYEAMEIIRKITEEVFQQTGEANIRKYLLEKQKEFEESSV